MATLTLPAVAKVSELRLAIGLPTDDVSRAITRRRSFSAPFREQWRGEILFAPMNPRDVHALEAWIESLDGQIGAFALPMTQGTFSAAAAFTGSLQAVPALGDDRVSLNLSPASGTLGAGSVFSVGDIDTDNYQLFEVLEDVAASAATSVLVAPRVRRTFTLASTVVVGSASVKLTLDRDEFSAPYDVNAAAVTLSVREAV